MQIQSIPQLLAAIDQLSEPARAAARARVEAAIERPAPAARLALGVLALDVAGQLRDDARGSTREAEVTPLLIRVNEAAVTAASA